MSSHLADKWKELTDDEHRIKKEKEHLKTLILLTNQPIIYGTDFNITISTSTANKFDSKEFRKNNPALEKQYRMNVTSTTISVVKK